MFSRVFLPELFPAIVTALILLVVSAPLSATLSVKEVPSYGAAFHAHFEPDDGVVEASISIEQDDGQLRQLNLNAAERYSDFKADGKLEKKAGRVFWSVPRDGGKLRYRVQVDSRRGEAFDARLTERWAIVRLDDLFPPARVRSIAGAKSKSTLTLTGPRGWSFISRYGHTRQNVEVSNPKRRFSRPTGWMAAGELGVRRDFIANRDIAVAAPRDENVRRIDILAFLRWTLPELTGVFPGFPSELLLVSAREAMWRGGLSGPGSVYLHADRPLISENGTSTLIHELVHVASPPPAPGDDWIVEGLAEYYSLEILRRTGGISKDRFSRALNSLQIWADRDDGRITDPSTGAHSARAALLFHALDNELKNAGGSLDAVVRRLSGADKINRLALRKAAEKQLGKPSTILSGIP